MDQSIPTEIISLEDRACALDDSPPVSPSQPSKFVIIASPQQISLVFGPIAEFPYHANLVKRFCDINKIPSGWLKKPDVYEIYGDSHEVRGGGWMEVAGENGELKIYGYSTTYGSFKRKDILYLYHSQIGSGDIELSFDS